MPWRCSATRTARRILAGMLAGALAACAGGTDSGRPGGAGSTPLPVTKQQSGATPSRVYELETGDRLAVEVFGEDDLSGEITIDQDGNVTLPLIGAVAAEGLTVRELEKKLVSKFENGYLKFPQVSVRVLNYQPFYILGEVNQPGSYEYSRGMTMRKAVALAGGFTPRAKKDVLYLERPGDDVTGARPVQPSRSVLPGDILHVRQRTLF